ncbi:hypothetical protein PI124_g449 [Phytophthora idaei]|nr:hypothetical protein PI125_g18237 [Phytophthora idaei]KAG3174145.1 hypothetical protein PI126_g493 [Phytophthora idaei]KAG3255016.1 hypothetical protein PI124_g449 [Phytophthora idaei]
MKKFLLHNKTIERWLRVQEVRTEMNPAQAQIRLEAFPELTRKSTVSIDVAAAEARIKQRHMRLFCDEITTSRIDAALVCIGPPNEDEADHTNTRYSTLSWKAKSHAIVYYFHPSLGNFDGEVTCRVFGAHHAMFSNWISKSEYCPKWLPFVEGLVARDVLEHVPA